ncbi:MULTISPECIES: hypothetical protein [unclassified Rhizobium]|uniref:hypothetical protein n=1 Tax=unclassified Rhizobium TaxID=2613769 RepID=UPI001613DC00|nr:MULTISPECIES: hypothetical protein [unclassified Rhizobium]MBB3288753.1 hypothetical protein [Rhizobium sp. BK252]MBB3403495.1 hypothetical protein [Rhizobium sp. BK289]MBB3416320.1 hypothetical protein [Rhizobium sp. BK284]MBB3483958.1 hypothetical protein [Rhizobium sp. BK347]
MANLFSRPKAPDPAPVQRMPDTEDPTVVAARRKAAIDAQTRSGRASTILTSRATRVAMDPGGTAYTNTSLGLSLGGTGATPTPTK